jgi:hypothetical protein
MIGTRRRAVTGVVAPALVAALLLVGCGDSASDDADDTPTELADAATVEQTTSTEAATTAPETTTTVAPVGMGTPIEAATRLFDAWIADDRITAATVAEPAAVDGIWAGTKGDYGQYSGCDSAEFDTSGCLFRGAPGTIQFSMARRGDAWVVTSAIYSPP